MGRTPGAKDKRKRKPREDGSKPAYMNNPVYRDSMTPIPEEYNARRIAFMQKIIPIGDLPKDDPARMAEVMWERFVRYTNLCAEWGMKIGNQGAYTAMGINRDDAYRWTTSPNVNPLISDTIKKVKQICAMYRENLMEDGKLSPVTGIFWQKNFDGYKDQQEVVMTPNNPLGETTDLKTLEQRYLEYADNPMIEQKDKVSDLVSDQISEKSIEPAERP